jgi:cell volume regulation protein A
VLGLLSFPSRLINVTGQGLLVSASLILLARPAAVFLTLIPFQFSLRELAFLSWVGLKGAVPVTLATFPLLFAVRGADELFDIVFFVVLISVLIQGWSMPLLARWLGVNQPLPPEAPVTLELSSLRHVNGDIVDYTIESKSRAAGRLVRELALPEGVVIAMITRGEQIIPPHGNTQINAGDHVIVVLRPETRPLLNNVFARQGDQPESLPAELEFPLRANVTVGELEAFYGIAMSAPGGTTLGQLLRERLPAKAIKVGASIRCGPIRLSVRGLDTAGDIQRVGMLILQPNGDSGNRPTP